MTHFLCFEFLERICFFIEKCLENDDNDSISFFIFIFIFK